MSFQELYINWEHFTRKTIKHNSHLNKEYSFVYDFHFNASRPYPERREKINLNFCFHTSLWCRKRFCKGLKGLHKTFWGNKKKRKQKCKLIFILITFWSAGRVNRINREGLTGLKTSSLTLINYSNGWDVELERFSRDFVVHRKTTRHLSHHHNIFGDIANIWRYYIFNPLIIIYNNFL